MFQMLILPRQFFFREIASRPRGRSKLPPRVCRRGLRLRWTADGGRLASSWDQV